MALRLIQIYYPDALSHRVEAAIQECELKQLWRDVLQENQMVLRILIPAHETQKILDILDEKFSASDGLRVIIVPVEATVPRPSKPGDLMKRGLISRRKRFMKTLISDAPVEELHEDIDDMIRFSWIYVIMIILSTIVAAVGILRNQVAITIGAMVIAPLLGPNVALSLATTLGDGNLAKKALKANLVGLVTALVIAAFLGLVIEIDTGISEISSRTEVSLGDIALALAAGCAATLSFTSRAQSALIGVMVAVALLPPLVVLGMLIGAGEWDDAMGAFLLLVTNIIGINLASVMTFWVQGIHPVRWWEADKARKATTIAVAIWSTLLIVLMLVIIFVVEY